MQQNRFLILYSQDKTTHTENCPILYISGRLLFDKIRQQNLLQLKFQNIKNVSIQKVNISVDLYNDAEDIINTIAYTYEALNIEREEFFGDQIPIYLNEKNSKSFIIHIQFVNFYDSEEGIEKVWKNTNSLTYDIEYENIIDNVNPELIQIYRHEDEKCEYDEYLLHEYSDIWLCSCGTLCFNDESYCHNCGKSKQWIKDHLNTKYLTSKLQEQEKLEEEERKKELERLENRPEIVKKFDAVVKAITNHKWTRLEVIKIGCSIMVLFLIYTIANSTFGFGNRRFDVIKFNGEKIYISQDTGDSLKQKFGSDYDSDFYDATHESFEVTNDDGDSIWGNLSPDGLYAAGSESDSNAMKVGGIYNGYPAERAFKRLGEDTSDYYYFEGEYMFLFNDKNELVKTIDMSFPSDYEDVTGDIIYDNSRTTMYLSEAADYYPDEFKESIYAVDFCVKDNIISDLKVYNIKNLL